MLIRALRHIRQLRRHHCPLTFIQVPAHSPMSPIGEVTRGRKNESRFVFDELASQQPLEQLAQFLFTGTFD